ncbi:PLP-dependent aminotransferase family protein, partial [Saprospiraceae bacterium]|nr:PLP-dependent aminotransferase family protein [Saprospiraceae bacterium]
MLPFTNLISINIRAERPIYLQLADQLIVHIQKGVIPQSYRLPSTRQMGILLRLNRQTIVSAYEEVANQGWIESIPYKGTFVRVDLPIIKAQQWKDKTKPRSEVTLDLQKSYKYIINRGSPDERLVPIDALARAYRNALKTSIKSRYLTNVDYQQNIQNESIIVNYLNSTRGLTTHASEIILTNGSQMGIYLAAQIILNDGDTIAVGKTSYLGADTIFTNKGAKLALFDVDDQGINVEQIEMYCQKNRLRCVYITPHHHLPTTVTLSASRRMRLLEIANKYDFYIIEDDYDYDFHYKGAPILPLASADDQCRVIYVGSMSKILAPGIRFGYLAAGAELVAKMKKLRRNI